MIRVGLRLSLSLSLTAAVGAIALAAPFATTLPAIASTNVGVIKMSPDGSTEAVTPNAGAAAAAAAAGSAESDPLAPSYSAPAKTDAPSSAGEKAAEPKADAPKSDAPSISLPSAPVFTMPGQPVKTPGRTYEKTIMAPMPNAEKAEPQGDVYYNRALKEKDPGSAGAMYMAAIAEFDKAGTRDDRYATCLSNLAAIELKDNQLDNAEQHVKKSLDASSNHALQAKNYHMMGDIKAKKNELEDADRDYTAVLEIFRKDGDMAHEEAVVLEKLASIKERQGKTQEANDLRVKATDLATFNSTDSNAQNLYRKGTKALIANDYPTAITQFEAALKEQPKFDAARKNLAICYQHEALAHNGRKEYDQAEANYMLALPAMEAAFGPQHAYTCTVLQGLVETLEAENKLADAEKYAAQWVKIQRDVYKSGPPVMNALRSYSRVLKAEKKDSEAAEIDKEVSGEKLPVQAAKPAQDAKDPKDTKNSKDTKDSKEAKSKDTDKVSADKAPDDKATK